VTFEQYLNDLADNERPLRNADLMSLSDMSLDGLVLLRDVWTGIDVVRKEDLLGRLIDLSEDNLDAEFNDFFRFCLGDENPEVRAKAIEGLWECDDRALLIPLITMLREDLSENVRSVAAIALGKFATLSQIGKMLEKDVRKIKEFLMQTIQNSVECQDVRRRAIEAVAPFNTPDVQQIIQDAYGSEYLEMRYSAVYAMGKSCDPRWLPTMLAELRNPDPAMRYEASNACGAMGEEPTVPHLIPLFQDDDRQAQVSAISAVGAIGGSLARKALRHCLKSSDDVAVEAAQEALENLEAGDETMSFTSGAHAPRTSR
jgi:HEAT repeat protein